MFEIHERLYSAAVAFRNAGGFINGCISLALILVDAWYIVHLVSIPFYIRDIARNTKGER